MQQELLFNETGVSQSYLTLIENEEELLLKQLKMIRSIIESEFQINRMNKYFLRRCVILN